MLSCLYGHNDNETLKKILIVVIVMAITPRILNNVVTFCRLFSSYSNICHLNKFP